MKPRELFLVILKVIGIYLIKDILFSIPGVADVIIRFSYNSSDFVISTMILALLSFAYQASIVYILLFKTGVIVDKLKLTAGFGDETFSFTMHRSSVYSIAVIVSGILVLVFSLTKLIKQVYYWLEYIQEKNQFYAGPPFEYVNLLTAITEVIIGIILLSKSQSIVNFIELKRREKAEA